MSTMYHGSSLVDVLNVRLVGHRRELGHRLGADVEPPRVPYEHHSRLSSATAARARAQPDHDEADRGGEDADDADVDHVHEVRGFDA